MKSKLEKIRPLVIAHRGFSGKYPENSLVAFEKAIEMGCNMMECDVHFTKDKKLVVTHDHKLGRIIQRKGTLSHFTLCQLQEMDIGSWVHENFKDQRPPSLDQLLDLIQKHKEVGLNIEIKKETIHNRDLTREMAKAVLDLCINKGVLDQIIISSFKVQVLREVRLLNPDVKIGILDGFPNTGLKLREYKSLRPYSYHPNFKRLRMRNIKKLRELGLKIYPYTPNSIQDYQKLLKAGVDGFITDHIDLLKKYFSEHF